MGACSSMRLGMACFCRLCLRLPPFLKPHSSHRPLPALQIIFTIAGLEHASECLNPDGHYMKGGMPGDMRFLKVRICVTRAEIRLCPAFTLVPRARLSLKARPALSALHIMCFRRAPSVGQRSQPFPCSLALQNFWDTPGFTKRLTEEQKAEKRLSELK